MAARSHAAARIAFSSSPAARIGRTALALFGLAFGTLALAKVVSALAPPAIYRRDFLAGYLLARAIADGADPYLSLQTLAERYLALGSLAVFPHPTPHPPTLGLLLLPLAWLDYRTASVLWLAVQLASLAASIYLVGRLCGARLAPTGLALLTAVLLAWHPVWTELATGQVGTIVLLLVAGGWLALQSDRQTLCGVLLGAALLVKPVTWPVLLILALRGTWRPVAAAAMTGLLGSGAVVATIGLEQAVFYLTRVLPMVGETYRSDAYNISLWSVGWRLFAGTSRAAQATISSPPLVPYPEAAVVVSVALPAIVLSVVALWWRGRGDQDSALGVALGASILVSPISWDHYLVLALVPLALVVKRLADLGWPVVETNRALVVAALLLPSQADWGRLAVLSSGHAQRIGELSSLPTIPSLLTLGPALAVGALAWLLASLPATRERMRPLGAARLAHSGSAGSRT